MAEFQPDEKAFYSMKNKMRQELLDIVIAQPMSLASSERYPNLRFCFTNIFRTNFTTTGHFSFGNQLYVYNSICFEDYKNLLRSFLDNSDAVMLINGNIVEQEAVDLADS